MNYTLDLSNEQATAIINKYNDYQVEHTNNYTLFRAKFKSATLTIFKTLTLLVQGAGAEKAYGEICSLLGLEVPAKEEKAQVGSELHSIIGTDEVGTGDFSGRLSSPASLFRKTKFPCCSV